MCDLSEYSYVLRCEVLNGNKNLGLVHKLSMNKCVLHFHRSLLRCESSDVDGAAHQKRHVASIINTCGRTQFGRIKYFDVNLITRPDEQALVLAVRVACERCADKNEHQCGFHCCSSLEVVHHR